MLLRIPLLAKININKPAGDGQTDGRTDVLQNGMRSPMKGAIMTRLQLIVQCTGRLLFLIPYGYRDTYF